jgi:hypothetical protein
MICLFCYLFLFLPLLQLLPSTKQNKRQKRTSKTKNKKQKSFILRTLALAGGIVLLVGFLLFFGRDGNSASQTKKVAVATETKPKAGDSGLQESQKDGPQSSGAASLPVPTTPNTRNSFVKADGSPLPNVIYLNAGPIDTDLPGTKARRQPLAYFSGKRLQLIQWSGPVQPGWIAELNRLGVEIVDYIPENAYLVYGDWKVLSAMQKRMADKSYVRWEGGYRATDKIQPGALESKREEPELFAVQMVLNPQANTETLKKIKTLQLSATVKEGAAGKYYNIITRLPPAEIAKLAAERAAAAAQSETMQGKGKGKSDALPRLFLVVVLVLVALLLQLLL